MTDTTPDLTIPGLAVIDLRVRVDNINKILTELVGRIKPARRPLGLCGLRGSTCSG